MLILCVMRKVLHFKKITSHAPRNFSSPRRLPPIAVGALKIYSAAKELLPPLIEVTKRLYGFK